MDYRKLRSFLTLARTLHFARAAAEVSLTQPALSQHIQSLEQSWGIKLFERNKRKVSLTIEGELLVAEVERTVQRLDNLHSMIKDVAAGGRGMLRLGYVGTSVLEPLLVSAIRGFRTRYPEVRLEPAEYSVSQQFSLLQSGELDVGVLRGPLPACRFVAHQVIHQSTLSAVIADDHPLASAEKVRLPDLAGETLIVQDDPDGVGLGGTVFRLYAASGVVPQNIIRTRDVSTAIDLAAVGSGVTFVPSSQRSFIRKDVAVLTVTGQDVATSLLLCWKKGANNLNVVRFVEEAQSLFNATLQE